jgi:hypothetical protein
MNDNNNKHQQRQVNEDSRAMIEKLSSNPFCQVAKSAPNEFDNDTPGKSDVYYPGPIKEPDNEVFEYMKAELVRAFSSPSAKFLLQDDTPDENDVDVKNPSVPWKVRYRGPIISNINQALYDAGVDVKNPSDPWDELLEYLTETPKKIKSLLMLLDEKDKRIRELESDLRIKKFLEEGFDKYEANHPEENTDNSDSSSN